MFFRIKPSGGRRHLQIVENTREGAKTRQSVLATLGRVEDLDASGKLEALLRSGARMCQTAMFISSHRAGTLSAIATRRIGGALVFGRLREDTDCRALIEDMVRARGFPYGIHWQPHPQVNDHRSRVARRVPQLRPW
jgi:hypothetical protein